MESQPQNPINFHPCNSDQTCFFQYTLNICYAPYDLLNLRLSGFSKVVHYQLVYCLVDKSLSLELGGCGFDPQLL